MPTIALDAWHLRGATIDGIEIPGVVGQAIEYQPQVLTPVSGGRLYESRHVIRRLLPVANLRTHALGSLIGGTGRLFDGRVNELYRVFASSGMVMRGARMAQDGTPGLATALGETRTAALGMVWLAGLRGGIDEVAVAELSSAFRSSDGTAAPIIETAATVPGEPSGQDSAYALESVTLDGDPWESVQDVDLRCDLKVSPLYPAAARYPTRLASAGISGPVSWRLGLTLFDMVRQRIDSFTSVVIAVTFRVLGESGGFGIGTITATCRGILAPASTLAGDQGSPLRGSMELLCRHDGTNAPVVWSVA